MEFLFIPAIFPCLCLPKIIAFKSGKPTLNRRGNLVQWRNEHVELYELVHPFGENFPAK